MGNSGDKLAGVIVLRRGEQTVNLTVFDNLSGAQDRHAVGDAAHRGQIVGNKQIGQPQLLLELLQQGQNLRLNRDVERRGGFIQHQDGRLQHQRAGNSHPLALAAGELAGGSSQQLGGEGNPGGNRLDAGAPLGRAEPAKVFQWLFDNFQ